MDEDIKDGLIWAEKEFITANIGDVRLNTRLIEITNSFLKTPGASVPQATKNWARAKGAYRFFSNKKVNSQNILNPHTFSTIERLKNRNIILAVQDTTSLDYGSHHSTTGLGS